MEAFNELFVRKVWVVDDDHSAGRCDHPGMGIDGEFDGF